MILGVRPEQLTDPASANRDQPDLQTIAAKIEIVEPTGPDTLATVMLNGVKAVARCHPQGAGLPGQQVQLVLDPMRTLLFDPASENRIA
ncbi:TOBE domain-containing protein [Chitinimonas koreensis]|uniref:TOBE domain-containing protein n=1 Tax=Chitinimonas koreensis TaxID=356302 RepID=UPI0016544426|nr:TOBE domain-containing protein [Chitinimonas koreensis]QNM96162.1 TOBE domain-containing protein [Chitinimonas koreensis]